LELDRAVAFEEKHANECPALIEMVTYVRAEAKNRA